MVAIPRGGLTVSAAVFSFLTFDYPLTATVVPVIGLETIWI
jgi:hypothetical protein